MTYVALVDGKKGAYGVVVPDLPVDAAYHNAIEAVQLWVEAGGKLPRPRSLMELAADREVRRALGRGVALIMVPVVRDAGRSAKANVWMDACTLQAIDEEAAAHGLTRSAFIASATLQKNSPRDLTAENEMHISARNSPMILAEALCGQR